MFGCISYLRKRYYSMWMPYLFKLGQTKREQSSHTAGVGKLGLLRLASTALAKTAFDQAEAR